MDKQSTSEAAWALLTEGVLASRLETHRLRRMLNRALSLVEASKQKDHFYQIAGDLIVAMPDRMDILERTLDRTSLALSMMGEDFLSSRLPVNDRNMVEEAVAPVAPVKKTPDKKAHGPLGGGPQAVIDRINETILNPRERDLMVKNVNHGELPLASKIYHSTVEPGSGYFKTITIGPHAAFRMDLRSITIEEVRQALQHYSEQLSAWGKKKSPFYDFHTKELKSGRSVEFVDQKQKITIVLSMSSPSTVKLVTVYRKNDPRDRN